MLFSGMIDSIIGYIGKTDSSIRRQFATFFTNRRTYSLFFLAVTGKHSENDIVTKKRKPWAKSKETKERERARHLHDGELQAEHQETGITRQKQKILRRSRIRAKMTEWKQCGFFERFRQGLEREGAGAVREAEQEKRRGGGGRDGGRRRGVTSTSSFIIIRTVANTVRFCVPEVACPRVKR